MAERKDKTKKEFEEILLEVRKVTRVTTGWRRMSFRAIILVWDKKWKIWLGLSKWADVTSAVKKASNEAYKNMFNVPITKEKSVPYAVTNKYKACIVRLLPATQGTWLKAGSSVRSVLDLAGYENILSKIIWSNNKLNNAIATVNALTQYKYQEHFMADNKDEQKENIENDKKEKKDDVEKKENIKNDKKTKVADVKDKKNTKDKAIAKKIVKKEETTKKSTTKKKATTTKTIAKTTKK